MIPSARARRLTEVVTAVSQMYEIPAHKILSAERTQRVSWARHVVFYLLRLDGWHLIEIAEACGRDHSSIHHGAKKVERVLCVDREAKREVDDIARLLALPNLLGVVENLEDATAAALAALEASIERAQETRDRMRTWLSA